MLSPLTPQQLANLSGRTANWIQAEIRAGRLHATVTMAGQCRRFWIDRGEVDRFVAEQQTTKRRKVSRAGTACDYSVSTGYRADRQGEK